MSSEEPAAAPHSQTRRDQSASAASRIPLRVASVGVLLLLAFGTAMRIAYARNSEIAVDEFEHLHAAYLVSRGQTPYVDFFEHHTPLLYYLAAALLPMRAPDFDAIIHARYLALLFSALTIGLSWWWVRRSFGSVEALTVTAFLVGNFFLFAFGTLVYLDTFAAPLVIVSALCLARSPGRPWRCAASAVALGVAVLFTQKAVVAALAPLAFFVSRGIHEGIDHTRRSRWLKDLFAYSLGLLATAALLPLLLGVHALDDFWYHNVTVNLAWQARHFPRRELRLLAATDGCVYFLAGLGTVAALRALARRRLAVTEDDVPTLFLGALALGIFVIPVVWEEYFILLVPFAVIVAAVTLVRWAARYLWADGRFGLFTGRPRFLPFVALGLISLMLADLILRSFRGEHPLSTATVLAVIVVWAVLGLVIALAAWTRTRYQPLLWVLVLLTFPVAEQADWIYRSANEAQRERVAYVLHNTGPKDPVFDGYSGYGLFRPHAYRYWFLHDEVQAMLSEEEKADEIVRALEEGETPIAIVDRYVRALPKPVLGYIAENYEDTPFPDIKKRRSTTSSVSSRPSREHQATR